MHVKIKNNVNEYFSWKKRLIMLNVSADLLINMWKQASVLTWEGMYVMFTHVHSITHRWHEINTVQTIPACGGLCIIMNLMPDPGAWWLVHTFTSNRVKTLPFDKCVLLPRTNDDRVIGLVDLIRAESRVGILALDNFLWRTPSRAQCGLHMRLLWDIQHSVWPRFLLLDWSHLQISLHFLH